MTIEVKTENEQKMIFKTVVKWRYVIRLIYDFLVLLMIVVSLIFSLTVYRWYTLPFEFALPLYVAYIVISFGAIVSNIADIICIIESNMLTAERYIGDDPKLAFLTEKKE